MSLGTTYGLFMTLLLIIPGSIGDRLMHVLTDKPDARDSGRRLITQVTWSLASLAIVELGHALLTAEPIGTFIVASVEDHANGIPAVGYALHVVLATALPTVTRLILRTRTVETIVLRGRTLDELSLDRARRIAEESLRRGHPPYVQLDVGDGVVEGWLNWASTAGHDPRPGYVLRAHSDKTIHWIPLDTVTHISFIDQGDQPTSGDQQQGEEDR